MTARTLYTVSFLGALTLHLALVGILVVATDGRKQPESFHPVNVDAPVVFRVRLARAVSPSVPSAAVPSPAVPTVPTHQASIGTTAKKVAPAIRTHSAPGMQEAVGSPPARYPPHLPAEPRRTPRERTDSPGTQHISSVVPAHLITRIQPSYPLRARRNGWEGLVVIRIDVDSRGKITAGSVVQSSGHRALDDAALAAVRRAGFAAARRAGSPVASTILLPIRFSLNPAAE